MEFNCHVLNPKSSHRQQFLQKTQLQSDHFIDTWSSGKPTTQMLCCMKMMTSFVKGSSRNFSTIFSLAASQLHGRDFSKSQFHGQNFLVILTPLQHKISRLVFIPCRQNTSWSIFIPYQQTISLHPIPFQQTSHQIYYELGSRHALLACPCSCPAPHLRSPRLPGQLSLVQVHGFAEFFQQLQFSLRTATEAFTDPAS